LVDLFVGQESGAEICERLRAASPRTNVLMISGAGRISPNAARAAGPPASSPRTGRRPDIAGAVRMVGLGMTVFRPHEAAAGPAAVRARARGARGDRLRRHQPRDRRRLFLSPHTVKEHTSTLYRKLATESRRGGAEGPASGSS
jgi:DNA-binding NarL/FixJ family response regulator